MPKRLAGFIFLDLFDRTNVIRRFLFRASCRSKITKRPNDTRLDVIRAQVSHVDIANVVTPAKLSSSINYQYSAANFAH